MLQSLRSRFIFTHILPTLLVVPFAGLIILYLVETQILLDDLAHDVAAQAAILAEVLNEEATIWENNEEARIFMARVSTAVTSEISLIDADGNVVATTNSSTPSVVELLPEQADTQVQYTLFQQTAESTVPVFNLEEQLAGYVRVSSTLAEASTLFTELRQLLLIIIVFELIIAALIGAYLATRMARPITAMTTAVSDIAHGFRVEPIAEKGPKEVKSLAQAVNLLSNQLQVLEKTRRQLLANLVHELGRPLGAMLAAVHVLRSGGDEDPELRQELLLGIENHLVQLQPLLDDLAQLHGQVLGARELNRQTVVLHDWLQTLLLPWRAAALEKGLAWEVALAANLPELRLDPDRMAQVMGNLLSNAIKFTPAGGEITVNATAGEADVVITITDSGPGISKVEQELVFDPFYRSREHTRFPQGMGLGLTIAKDLVEAHGGHLIIASRLGQGSQFIIRLPVN